MVHAELLVKEQGKYDAQKKKKMPNIRVTDEDPMFGEFRRSWFLMSNLHDNPMSGQKVLVIPTYHSGTIDGRSFTPTSDVGSSPCSSPTPNLISLSPMPDLRRDSQAEELLTLPAPDGFADSRRNSSNLPQECVLELKTKYEHFLIVPFSSVFSFDETSGDSTVKQQLTREEIAEKLQEINETQNSDTTPGEAPSEGPITVTSTTLDSSSLDDTTIQEPMISPDSDSGRNECLKQDDGSRLDNRGSCSNSIISSDSMLSEAYDSKCSFPVKNSESEIGNCRRHLALFSELIAWNVSGHADSDILDSMKHSETSDIGHIDSPENSEMQNSESFADDMSSLGRDLISAMMREKYDSVRECLESQQCEKPRKYCSLAKFEGNDIGRRSVRRPERGTNLQDVG